MKSAWIITGIVGVVMAAALLAGCSGESENESAPPPDPGQGPGMKETHEGQQTSESQEAATLEITQTQCPVMDLPINEDIYVDYKGRRIYFCCEGCDDKFLENPEKYLAKLDK